MDFYKIQSSLFISKMTSRPSDTLFSRKQAQVSFKLNTLSLLADMRKVEKLPWPKFVQLNISAKVRDLFWRSLILHFKQSLTVPSN